MTPTEHAAAMTLQLAYIRALDRQTAILTRADLDVIAAGLKAAAQRAAETEDDRVVFRDLLQLLAGLE